MINLAQLREYVIRPALQRIAFAVPWSQGAENLVFGTGLIESGYTFLDQSTPGPGPAYGFWQMEEPTHRDIWENFLRYKPPALCLELLQMAGHGDAVPPPITTLHGNLFYAAVMCRLHYLRASEPLPDSADTEGLAAYYKRWYNTPLGSCSIVRASTLMSQAVV